MFITGKVGTGIGVNCLATGISVKSAKSDVSVQSKAAGVSVQWQPTGLTLQDAGGATAFSVMQPSIALNWISRAQ